MVTESVKMAYIAGILDGEGCITATHSRGYAILDVQIGNTSRLMLEFIADTFGNTVMRHDRKRSKRPYYRWSIKSMPAVRMLEKLLPYLIIKRRQAVVGIQTAYATPRQKEELVTEISRLNKEGAK